MKATAIAAGLALAAAVAFVVNAVFAAQREADPGFMGPGVFIADLNLALELLLLAGLTFGAYLARRGRIEAHRVNQTIWVLVNAALVVFMMFGSLADVKLAAPADLLDLRVAVTWLHAAIGTLTVIAGLWLVLQMNDVLPERVHLRGWKALMRMTLAGYWAVALLGLATYYLWYAAGR
jgi:hypothetical protein